MTESEIRQIVAKATKFSKNESVIFCSEEDVNEMVRGHFVKYPHLYVLSCLMDKQIDADRAWRIPFTVCDTFGTYNIYELNRISEENYRALCNEKKLHRFNDSMAQVFKSALERIIDEYGGDASSIWKGKPGSATVVARFLEFDGCGIKIATMATNLLHRGMGVEFSDYSSIDVSPDVHIIRVFTRLGLLNPDQEKNNVLAIYKAREINPSYPGLIDGYFWQIGTTYCRPTNPKCLACPIESICPKQL